MMQDSPDFYYDGDAFVYVGDLAIEVDAVWNGIDALERRGVPLEQIGRKLAEDWPNAVVVLALIGRRS